MSSGAQKIYVSLTAIGARLGMLGKVLASILDQSLAPDAIFLVVSEEGRYLDSGITAESIPADVAALIAAGRVTLIFSPNTGPYRKLLPVLERFHGTDCLIATADDDTIYPRDWLANLVEAYRTHRCVIAYRGRAMRVIGRQFDSYRRWSKVPTWRDNFGDIDARHHGLFTLPTGVFGVVYHAGFFPDLELLTRLMDIAPLQDDLAFKAAALVNEIPTHVLFELDGEDPSSSFEEISSGTQLFDSNIDNNDLVWTEIVDLISQHYGFDIDRYVSAPRGESSVLEADWANRVLSFWFDRLSAAERFGKQPGIDEKVRNGFGDLYFALRDTAPSMPCDDANTALAAVIVFDQFSRRIFRREARKFATDALALGVAREALARGFDAGLPAERRLFFYLPFSHSEDISDQERGIALIAGLDPEALRAALANRDIILRFGRFPHRNKVLGRQNTAMEVAEYFSGPDGG